MVKRQKIGKYYVTRTKDGQFKKWVGIGKSLRADRKKKNARRVSSGYGHRGDTRR